MAVQASPRSILSRLHLVAAVVRGLLAPPLAFFGVLVFFSVFGEGSRVVGTLLVVAAMAGPAVHGGIWFGLARRRAWGARLAVYGTLGLWLVDGVAAGVFAVPGVRNGAWGMVVPLVAVSLVHAWALVLATRGGGPTVEQGPSTG